MLTLTPFQALACPLDGAPLERDGGSWRCPDGHNFDVASQGYTHLLPVQKKRSLDPGDSKEMIAARQRFLNTGHYRPIADAVNRAILKDLPPGTCFSCLDAGSGEGYYLRQLAAAEGDYTLHALGLDISKWAIQTAAKQDKRVNWVVGSNANLPVQSGTVDRLLCMFGFPVYGEFARALKSGGQLLQVDAGPNHLRELREIIYPTLKPERETERPVPAGFVAQHHEKVRFTVNLASPEAIADLLCMTPHLYRASPQGREKAMALQALTVSAEVSICSYLKL